MPHNFRTNLYRRSGYAYRSENGSYYHHRFNTGRNFIYRSPNGLTYRYNADEGYGWIAREQEDYADQRGLRESPERSDNDSGIEV